MNSGETIEVIQDRIKRVAPISHFKKAFDEFLKVWGMGEGESKFSKITLEVEDDGTIYIQEEMTTTSGGTWYNVKGNSE